MTNIFWLTINVKWNRCGNSCESDDLRIQFPLDLALRISVSCLYLHNVVRMENILLWYITKIIGGLDDNVSWGQTLEFHAKWLSGWVKSVRFQNLRVTCRISYSKIWVGFNILQKYNILQKLLRILHDAGVADIKSKQDFHFKRFPVKSNIYQVE